VGIASINHGKFKQHFRSASDQKRGEQSGQTGRSTPVGAWHGSLLSSSSSQGTQEGPYNLTVDHSRRESSRFLP